ncbi:MAG: hypothetical protein KAV44_04270 [Bacteroidales bacterium]|nr:hypothetical protein [Bacteroidales bacterium]
MNDNYYILIKKIDQFIRKYYLNQIIKGGIYCLAVIVLFYLLFTVIEYFAYFDSTVRSILFYAYLIINIYIIGKFIFYPVLKLIKIGKVLSYEQAAEIIGKHFSDIDDRLLNTLQLKKESEKESSALIIASIDQKIKKLKPIPFTNAIKLSKNKRYLKYAIPQILIIILLLLIAPKLITEPTKRIINYNEIFKRPFPFKIEILNDSLKVAQHDDFKLNVKITGDEVPENIYLETDNHKYRLTKDNTVSHHYNFVNVQKDLKFKLIADNYISDFYRLTVFPKPIILNFESEIIYPKYINRTNETCQNTNDLIIPAGTKVNWNFFTKDVKDIIVRCKDKTKKIESDKSNVIRFSKSYFNDQLYSVSASNQFVKNEDSLMLKISVIPDAYPNIIVEEFQDSLFDKRLYFNGLIKDDYGFNKLIFSYLKSGQDKNINNIKTEKLSISKKNNQQQYYYFFDIDKLEANPGDEIEYYFEIWDNDEINGSKSSRSQKMFYKIPTLKEIEQKTEESNKKIKSDIEKSISEIKKLQKDIDELNKELIDKKKISWQEKKQIQDLLDKYQNIQENLEKIQKQNVEKAFKEEQYKDIDERILEKQKKLEELFENILTDELKELFKELQEMLDKIQKEDVNKMLEKLKLSSEDIEEQLDRNLELFKQLEFEKILEETIEKLKKLAEEQLKLSEETKNKKEDKEKLAEEQNKLNEKFDEITEDIDDLEEKNENLENKHKIKDTGKEEEQIKQEMQNSLQMLEMSKLKKASKSQMNASDQMNSLQQMLFQMKQNMKQQRLSEDINTLREILENLIDISFDQEKLVNKLKTTNIADPKYIDIIQQQNKIKDDLTMVEDSLIELGKRQFMIEYFINNEIDLINQNLEVAIENIIERRKSIASAKQQFVMTSVNNLALLLAETLRKMQSNFASQCQMSGKSSCKQPGCGSSKMESMSKMQQQLNQQIEQMKKGMSGKGEYGKDFNKNSMSEKFARMAAQQQAIRNKLQKYRDEFSEQGLKDDGINAAIKNMEKTEEDLVNKIISEQTLLRQQEILTRLLKSEKAELKREKEEKRESTEAKNKEYSNPNKFFEYKRIKSMEAELLKTVPPNLRHFYKEKLNKYLYQFQGLKNESQERKSN